MLGAYIRGRLLIAGVTGNTPVCDALDVVTVIVMDCPGEELRKWRTGMDRAILTAQTKAGRVPDRATWGLAPDQIEQTRAVLSRMGG